MIERTERPNTHDRLKKKRGNPMMIFGSAMTLFYLGLGSTLMINNSFLPSFTSEFRPIFAVMLIIYGLYRGYRLFVDSR